MGENCITTGVRKGMWSVSSKAIKFDCELTTKGGNFTPQVTYFDSVHKEGLVAGITALWSIGAVVLLVLIGCQVFTTNNVGGFGSGGYLQFTFNLFNAKLFRITIYISMLNGL